MNKIGISFAQNFEDVMLWRALNHVQKGYYIDVGAAWPDIDSVTKAFYQHGWHGINIEPNPEFHSLLEEQRPDDINLKIAVSDKPGHTTINFFQGLGLSTLDDDIAQKHTNAGRNAIQENVKVTTLNEIWENHVPKSQQVHFLKVDVEGLEEAVLRGNNWKINRPWIVIVEATVPMSQEASYETWEDAFTGADYEFVYEDGLNRFYLAIEHHDLASKFKFPPNVFDEFVMYSTVLAEIRESNARRAAQEACEELASNTERLQSIINSRSWRLTKPLRIIARKTISTKQSCNPILSWELGKTLSKNSLKSPFKKAFRSTIEFASRSNTIKKVATRLFSMFPSFRPLGYRLKDLSQRTHLQDDIIEKNGLSPLEMRIYNRLLDAQSGNKK